MTAEKLKEAEKIKKRVLVILVNQLALRENEISLVSTMDDLGGDSLDGVEIVMALEEEFEAEISDEEMESVRNVRGVIYMILRKQDNSLSGEAADEIVNALKDAKGNKVSKATMPADKPLKKAVARITSIKDDEAPSIHGGTGPRRTHLDDLVEYTICQTPTMEFLKLFNHVFRNAETAHMYSYKTVGESDAWCIRMSTRMTDEAVDTVARLVEVAGFAFVKTTEHFVQLPGDQIRFGIVTAVHLSLITHTM